MIVSRLYGIVDVGFLRGRSLSVRHMAEGLRAAGVRVVQLRDKDGSPAEVLENAAVLLEVFAGTGCLLVMNDRVDLALLAGFGAVHLGQGDLPVADVRSLAGERFVVGISTHTSPEAMEADLGSADYVAVGPVFATGTKPDAAAVAGLDGVRRARALTSKPLVAIGGITLANAASVFAAGADSVAVISGLIVEGRPVESVARDFMDTGPGE